MAGLIHVFYIVIILIIWVVTCGYITSASVALFSIRNEDPNLKTAYTLTTVLAVLVWTAIGVLLILGLVGLFFSPEIAAAVSGLFGVESALVVSTVGVGTTVSVVKTGISIGTYIILGLVVLTMAITGAVAFAARYYMSQADLDRNDSDFQRAYKQLLIAGILSLISIGFPLVITLTLLATKQAQAPIATPAQ